MLFLYAMYFSDPGWHGNPLDVLLIVSTLVLFAYPAIYWSLLVQKQTSGLRIANYFLIGWMWATIILWPTPFFYLVAFMTMTSLPAILGMQLIVPTITVLRTYKARNKPAELPPISRNQIYKSIGIYYGGIAIAIFVTHLIGWPNPFS